MVFPNRVVGTFIHCIHPLSVFLPCDFPMVIRKDPGHDHPLLIELPYGLNFAGLVCTVIFYGFGVLML